MNELEYQPHLQRYRSLFAISSESPPENILAAEREAQHTHALAVFNPLRDWATTAIELSDELKNQNATFYMKYGAGRRLRMMFYAYRQIIFTADPKRSEP